MNASPINMVLLLAAMALLPFFLIMVTSFVKIAVVLSILRTAIGVQQAPPNQVITGLALVLSIYVMAPVGTQAYQAISPTLDQIEAGSFEPSLGTYREIATQASAPLKTFLTRHADLEERTMLHQLAVEMHGESFEIAEDDLIVSIPAFVMTELKEAFVIGFLLFVPFIVVDLVVANVLLSLGMHMLSPTTISLPFKLLLFVLVDGWFLVVKGLLLGYV